MGKLEVPTMNHLAARRGVSQSRKAYQAWGGKVEEKENEVHRSGCDSDLSVSTTVVWSGSGTGASLSGSEKPSKHDGLFPDNEESNASAFGNDGERERLTHVSPDGMLE